MLNWAARYYPIVRILKTYGLYDSASLLEIGSGSIGIGRFRKVPFVGCDISFPFEPVWPMTPMIASAAELPVKDNEFDVVLASDILEHVPPDLRKAVIEESLRVARKLVIFGFPCGELAWQSDRDLLETYLKKNVPPPEWLTEHMEAKFPESDLFGEIDGWEIQQHDNENISFHSWLMRREMSRIFVKISSILMRIAPPLIEALLSKTNCGPVYRKIFVLRKLAT